jgi:DNA polymerase-1
VSRVTLIVDAENILYRAFHVMPPMMSGDRPVSAIVGFFKTVFSVRDRLGTSGCVFCFDSSQSLRRKILPAYKAIRDTPPAAVLWQIKELRDRILPQMGFNNVFAQDGYEADDIIAAVAFARCKQAVIVSSDKDLLQCLRPGVEVYDVGAKCVWTGETFHARYGVTPAEWARVKALMGDGSDNVRGVPGVGLTTALRLVRKEKVYGSVLRSVAKMPDLIERNLKLMALPLEGVEVPELEEDDDTEECVERVLARYGIRPRKAVV